jgi:hypothetical protein
MKCTYLCLQYVPADAASSSASSRRGRRVAQCAACSMGNNGPPCRAGGHLDHVSGAVGRQPRPDTALGFHPALRLRIKQPRPITYLCSVGSSWCTSSSTPSRCGRRVAECAACSTGAGGATASKRTSVPGEQCSDFASSSSNRDLHAESKLYE